MLHKPSEKNSTSLYYTLEEKSSKLGLFSAARVVLLLKVVVWYLGLKKSKLFFLINSKVQYIENIL